MLKKKQLDTFKNSVLLSTRVVHAMIGPCKVFRLGDSQFIA